jgi:hypothetical protein
MSNFWFVVSGPFSIIFPLFFFSLLSVSNGFEDEPKDFELSFGNVFFFNFFLLSLTEIRDGRELRSRHTRFGEIYRTLTLDVHSFVSFFDHIQLLFNIEKGKFKAEISQGYIEISKLGVNSMRSWILRLCPFGADVFEP